MSVDVSSVLLLFKGDAAPALKSMAEVKGGMTEVGQSGNKLSGLGAIATGVATGLLVVGAVVAGVGAISLKMAGDFQQATTQLVTGAGESQSAVLDSSGHIVGGLDFIRKGLLAMAGEVGQTPIELAKGLFMIESAGYHGADGLKVLKVAAEGAKVGGADLATTADAVTTVMKDYKLSADHAGDATNFLVSVVAQGKTHMQDLAGSLSAILPTASALGVPLDQIGGAMATLTARGTPAANAATYLRFTMSALAAETPKGSAALKNIGLTSTEVGDTLTHKGLLPALQLVQEHLQTKFPQGGAAMFASLKDITGGTRGLGAALGLTGQNLGDFITSTGKVSKAIDDGHGKVIGWDLAQKDFNTRLDQFKAGASAAAIEIGTKLMPMAGKLLDWAGQMLPKIMPVVSALADKLPGAISAIGAVLTPVVDTLGFLAQHFSVIAPILGTLVAGWVAWNVTLVVTRAFAMAQMAAQFVGGLIAIVSHVGLATTAQILWDAAMDANPIGVIVLAIVAFVGILVLAYNNIKPVRDAINWLWSEIQILWHWIVGGSPGLVPAFQELISIIGTVISVALLPIKLEFMALSWAVGVAWNVLQAAGGWLVSTFSGMLNAVGGTIGNLVSSILGEFGRLPGQLMGVIGGIPGAVAGLFGSIGGAVSGALGSLWNAISNAAGTALNMAGSIGDNIVNGIKNGINSAISGLSGALHALAMLLPGPVKDALGIHSGSTVFAEEVGEHIPEGIGAGIARSTAAVDALKAHTRKLLGVAGGAAAFGAGGSLAGAMGGASLAGGAAGGQTINNYFNAPIDPAAGRRIGRDLAWELKA